MKQFKKIIFLSLLLSLVVFGTAGCGKEKIVIDTSQPPLKIGWSDWVGWAPWKIVEVKKLFAENGANAELVYFDDYTKSLEAFEGGAISALSTTLNDAMAIHANVGDVQAILVNDVSNGGDGILVKKDLNINSVKELKGKIVSLEENSVSHYLFLRALEENGVDPSSITINNVSADLAGEAFLGSGFLDEKYTQAVVTWNPHLAKAKKEGKGKVIFDSSQIYGEITDILVTRKSLTENRAQDLQAVINAWYGAMSLIEGSKTHDDAVGIMAKSAGVTLEEFESLMLDTEIFTKSRKTAEFLGIQEEGKLHQFGDKINNFMVSQGIVEEKVDLSDFVNASFVIEYYNEH